MNDLILDDLFDEVVQFAAQIRIANMLKGKQDFDETVKLFTNDIEKLGKWRAEAGITK